MRTSSVSVVYLSRELSVFVSFDGVFIKGPNGTLSLSFGGFVKGNCLIISSLLTRGIKSDAFNMMKGLKLKHVKWLVLRGSGFKANLDNQTLVLKLGFSHFVQINVPAGITIEVHQGVKIRITGSCL